MEIECDLASIRDEDLLRKMWQQSEDFGRKKEIRSHLYKLRESRLRELYSSGGPGGEIMNPSTDLHYGKTPLTPSHGDSLVDQSFQSLKSKEIRDSLSPTHEVKFRNSGGVAGGVLVPDTTGWDVQTSSEVSPDGRAFRTETLAKTDGVEKLPGGHAEFSGRNEQKSSASHQGDDKNYVKKAAESSKTHLQEKVVIGDENSGRTEMKSSSVTSSSKVTSSSSQQVFTSDDPGFDMEPRRLTQQHDQRYQNMLQAANNSSTLHSERQQFSRNERNERQESTSNLHEENKKYVDMDKASPEYQQHVQYLMSQPGAIVSNTVEYPKPGVKMITTVKKLPDGTTVKTKRYETEATAANTGADSTSISHTTKQQQQQKISSSSTTSQKMTEKRVQDSEDVFTRLARTRDSNVPASPRNAPETPSNEDVYSRLQQSRDHKFSDSLDQRSTQILRDTNQQHPGSRNAPNRRPSDLVENVEMISTTNKTVKKDLNRSEKITSSDFIQNERDRYVLDQDSPSRRGPDGYPEALVPITPSRHGGRPTQPDDDYPTNGYNATEVIKQSSSSKSSAKFSESRRYSTETVESYQHSENENQDYTTRGYPSNRRPIDEPKGQSPRPGGDFSTHGFPSVRSDKPISDRSRPHDDTTERVHIVHTDRGDVNHSDTTTTRSNYSTNETRRHVTKEDFSTHGFPSVRAGTPTRDSPRRPLGSEPSPGDSPRRPSGQEPPAHQVRKPPSDGYSTHGFPSVKSGSPTEDSPRRPSGPEPTNQGRRPTTEDFSTHGFPSVKPAGRSSTPTQSSSQYDSPNRVDRDDTASVTSDRSNSVIYEKKIDAAHQAFARSLRCASPVEPVRRDSTDRTPRSSIGSIRNTYSPSKRDTRSPSHDSVTNSESSRISSATVTKSTRPTEVRRVSHPKSPIGKSSPSHVSNETIDLTLTRKITAKPSPDKTTGKPSPDDEDHDHSPARSTSTVSSHKQVTTSRTSMTKRLTEDTSRRPRRPSGNEPTTPTSTGRTPRSRAVPETVAARRNIFEKTPGDISPMPSGRRPSYMEPTKSSLEHRKDSLEITKTNFSRKSSMEEEPYEPSPRTSVKFGVGLKHKEEPKPKRKLSSSDIPNIEDVFELELLEEMLNIVTLYEQRRRIRAQIRVVKKLLETKTKEEVSRMTKISTIRKTSSSSVRESPTPKRESRPERYQPTDDDIDSESIIESRHVEEHEEIIRERSISPQTKTSRIVTKVTEVRKIAEPSSTPNKRTPLKTKDEPKESKPIWATKNILKKPSENEKVTRALSAKKTTSTSSSSMSRTQQQTHRQRVSTDDDCVTSSYGIGPTDEDGRPLFGIRALKKKTTTNNNTVQPSETTKVTGTVITEKYYSENGAEPVGERKVTVYSTNPEDLVDLETQYDRRDSETVKREKLSKDGVTTVTKVQKIGKYKPGEIPSLTDDAEFSKSSSKMVRRGSVKEMSEKFIRKESSSSVTEKSSSGYPKAGLILRTRTNSGATADTADQYEVRGKSTEYDYESEDDVEIRTSRKHSKVVTESEDETEIRRKVNTRSFLNSGGSKVTGVDDVLDRMRNADNVVVDGDTMEDREARSLLNKFLGASVLMSGMESMIPQMELRKSTAGADNKQEVKTTRVTKTIKTGTTGGSSSSPVARETCDFEEIWDEETLKQLLEKSTSYEERRSIRARLRQLMADREGQSTTTTEKTETKKEDGGVVTTTTKVTTRTITGAPKPVSPFAKFQQLDKQNSLQSPKMFK